jgi:hypothetical protein
MNDRSTGGPHFLTTVRRWLAERGEVGVLLRFSYAAGSKSCELFESMGAFEARLATLAARTSVIVFQERQLPLRGLVDAAFVADATRQIGEDAEYLIAGLDETSAGSVKWFDFQAGEGRAALQEDLKDLLGKRVAVGPYPPWLEDGEHVISAVVPERDGSVVIGVY